MPDQKIREGLSCQAIFSFELLCKVRYNNALAEFLIFIITSTDTNIVSTPPRMYAHVLLVSPSIMGEIKIYDEQTYVMNMAGNNPIATGFLCLARYTAMHHKVMAASV